MHSYLSTRLLGYVHTDPHASPLPKNKDLPVIAPTCGHVYECVFSWLYVLILILSFRLTVKIYPFMLLLLYVSTCRYTRSSVYLFSLFLPFRHNMHIYLSTRLLGHVHTDLPEK